MNSLCFILLPEEKKESNKDTAISKNKWLSTLVRSAIDRSNLEPIYCNENNFNGQFSATTIENWNLCDAAIIDLSHPNAYFFYLLGMRQALKPATTIVLSNTDLLSIRNQDLVFIKYSHNNNGQIENQSILLEEMVRSLKKIKSASCQYPIYRFEEKQAIQKFLPHEKTDVFRETISYNSDFKSSLVKARIKGIDAIKEFHKTIIPLKAQEAGVVIDLLLSYRGESAYKEMVACYHEMNKPLQNIKMVREQLAFALNRLGKRDEALAILQDIIGTHGNDPETNALAGRIYKDLWAETQAGNESANVKEYIEKAIEYYKSGFDADWRDAFPGINLITLATINENSEVVKEYLPLVKYAIQRKITKGSSDYWDTASLMELEILEGNIEKAKKYLENALTLIPKNETWMAKTTANNLKIIQKHVSDKDQIENISSIINKLNSYKH